MTTLTLDSLSLVQSHQLVPDRIHSLVDLTCPGRCGLRARVVPSIREVDARAWDQLTVELGPYAQRGFLEAMERAAPPDTEHRYVVFTDDGQPIGVASVRLSRFFGPDVSTLLPDGRGVQLLARAAGVEPGPLAVPVLVCGTRFGCGATGVHFDAAVPPREALAQLFRVLRAVVRELPSGRRPVGLLLEDPDDGSRPQRTSLLDSGWAELATSPGMVLEVDPAWQDFDGYLAALKSKFRVKAKRAYAKSRQLVVRPLDADDIVRYQPRLQQLHAEVVGQAGFRLDGGCVGAFAPLRRSLGSSFVVHGYFLDDELVGYLTAFVRPGRLDAHSVGFDYALNREHSIYPRMLYDYLRIAMERGLGMVDYGRTAQEIKSTVGAVPVPTRSWVRHRSEWINPVLGWLLEGIEPEVQPQRQPFKAVAAARSAA